MTNLRKITVLIDQDLIAEAEKLAQKNGISLDQLTAEALEQRFENEVDLQLRHLANRRERDQELNIEELAAGITEANIHREID